MWACMCILGLVWNPWMPIAAVKEANVEYPSLPIPIIQLTISKHDIVNFFFGGETSKSERFRTVEEHISPSNCESPSVLHKLHTNMMRNPYPMLVDGSPKAVIAKASNL